MLLTGPPARRGARSGRRCGSGSKRCETGALTGAPIEHEGAQHTRYGPDRWLLDGPGGHDPRIRRSDCPGSGRSATQGSRAGVGQIGPSIAVVEGRAPGIRARVVLEEQRPTLPGPAPWQRAVGHRLGEDDGGAGRPGHGPDETERLVDLELPPIRGTAGSPCGCRARTRTAVARVDVAQVVGDHQQAGPRRPSTKVYDWPGSYGAAPPWSLVPIGPLPCRMRSA